MTVLVNGVQIGSEKSFGAGECTTLPKFKSMVMQVFGAQFRLFKLSPDVLFDGLNLFGPYSRNWSPGVTTNFLYRKWFNADVRTAPPEAGCNIQVMLIELEKDDDLEEDRRAFWFLEKQRALRNPADGINGVPKFFETFSNQGTSKQDKHRKEFRKYEAFYRKMKSRGVIDSDDSEDEESEAPSTRKDGRRNHGGLRVPRS